jgi:hypothetical protein
MQRELFASQSSQRIKPEKQEVPFFFAFSFFCFMWLGDYIEAWLLRKRKPQL